MFSHGARSLRTALAAAVPHAGCETDVRPWWSRTASYVSRFGRSKADRRPADAGLDSLDEPAGPRQADPAARVAGDRSDSGEGRAWGFFEVGDDGNQQLWGIRVDVLPWIFVELPVWPDVSFYGGLRESPPRWPRRLSVGSSMDVRESSGAPAGIIPFAAGGSSNIPSGRIEHQFATSRQSPHLHRGDVLGIDGGCVSSDLGKLGFVGCVKTVP